MALTMRSKRKESQRLKREENAAVLEKADLYVSTMQWRKRRTRGRGRKHVLKRFSLGRRSSFEGDGDYYRGGGKEN